MEFAPTVEAASPQAARDSFVAVQTAALSGSPFTLRRVANPRYRPPTLGGPPILTAAKSRLRALDHFRAQLFHQAPSQPTALTQWEIAGGEQYRSDDALEITAAGSHRAGEPQLDALRVSGRHRSLQGSLIDAEPITIGRQVLLGRLRGAVLRYTDPREARWLALGGVPTPIPHLSTPPLALGGVAVENVRFDEAVLSASGFAFQRGAGTRELQPTSPSDTLAGRGVAGTLGWNAPILGGSLGGRLGTQLHSLEGHRALAVQHALEWSYRSPTLMAWLSDERGTRRLRVLGTDRIAPAPRREDRWNVQNRFARGRAEAHVTGAIRDGGDPALASRTFQLGGSGNLGHSSWYGGSDVVWDWRALTGQEERRISVYGGGSLSASQAWLGRLEHARRGPDSDLLTAMAEASLALSRGARLGLEPRLGWQGGRLHQGDLATRFSWPLAWMSSRITASVAAGGDRVDGFRGHVREAALAISFVPRLHDHGDLEVRRFDQDGRGLLEYRAAYETEMERYDMPGQGWFAGRDTGRVMVFVTRTGNGSGVPDILISLDGKELRFTDAEGAARFDHVTPGVHVVAIEERSLPAHHEVVYASRIFVTIERGRVPEPIRFAIARSERRTNF